MAVRDTATAFGARLPSWVMLGAAVTTPIETGCGATVTPPMLKFGVVTIVCMPTACVARLTADDSTGATVVTCVTTGSGARLPACTRLGDAVRIGRNTVEGETVTPPMERVGAADKTLIGTLAGEIAPASRTEGAAVTTGTVAAPGAIVADADSVGATVAIGNETDAGEIVTAAEMVGATVATGIVVALGVTVAAATRDGAAVTIDADTGFAETVIAADRLGDGVVTGIVTANGNSDDATTSSGKSSIIRMSGWIGAAEPGMPGSKTLG